MRSEWVRVRPAGYGAKCGVFILLLCPAALADSPEVRVEGNEIRIEFDRDLHSRVTAKFDGKETRLGGFSASEFITAGGRPVKDFALIEQHEEQFGVSRKYQITGSAQSLKKTVTVTLDDAEFPRMAVFEVQYTNTGAADLKVAGWTSHAYSIDSAAGRQTPAFWSYQSGFYESRPDWVVAAQARLPSGKLHGHERQRLRRRYACFRHLAPRRRHRVSVIWKCRRSLSRFR